MSTPKRRGPARQTCCVTIGFESLTMPLADGLRVVELLQRATWMTRHYSCRGITYEPKTAQIPIQLDVLSDDRLHAPRTAAAGEGE